MGCVILINNNILVQNHFFCKKRSNKKVLEIFETNIIIFAFGKTHDFDCFK